VAQEKPADWSAADLDRAQAAQVAGTAVSMRKGILKLRTEMEWLTVRARPWCKNLGACMEQGLPPTLPLIDLDCCTLYLFERPLLLELCYTHFALFKIGIVPVFNAKSAVQQNGCHIF